MSAYDHISDWADEIAKLAAVSDSRNHSASIHNVPLDRFDDTVANVRVKHHEGMLPDQRYLAGDIKVGTFTINLFSVYFSVGAAPNVRVDAEAETEEALA